MKHIAIAAVAGLASSAAAQSASLSIIASGTPNAVGSSVITLSVYAQADFGTHISGGEFSIVGSGLDTGLVADMVATPASWGAFGGNDRGYAGNASHNGLVFGQLIAPPFFPPAEDSSFANGPVLLGSFEVTLAAGWAGPTTFTLAAGQGSFVIEIFDEGDSSLTQLSGAAVSYGSVTVGIPAPSSVALLGFGGLVATRRRR